MLNNGANVMVYFCSRAVPQNLLEDDQYSKLTKLREEYQTRGLLASFETVADLAQAVTLHVTSLVTGLLTKERLGNQPIPSVGSVTAPTPDLRVSIAGAVAAQGMGSATPILKVAMQNHSPVPVYFSGLQFGMPDGSTLVVFRDGLSQANLYPEKIEPGNEKTVILTPDMLPEGFEEKLISLYVTDKIDRRYFVDPASLKSAFKSYRQWARGIAKL